MAVMGTERTLKYEESTTLLCLASIKTDNIGNHKEWEMRENNMEKYKYGRKYYMGIYKFKVQLWRANSNRAELSFDSHL